MSTRFMFFSGKGGVGKTTLACTHAVRYSESGRRTLIVTTDPASNLADVFEQPIGHSIFPIQGLPNLWAMEIDPDRATQEYVDRAMAPIRAAFPAQMVQVMEEQMSGPCTAEVAAFDRFTDFLDSPADGGGAFDVVIFDTAPTGHTLRLLELPVQWSQSIDAASAGSGQTCIGPAAAIQDAQRKYRRALAAMRSADRATFTFVLHAEAISIKETRRAIDELRKLGISNFELILNALIPAEATDSPLFAAQAAMQAGYQAQIERDLPLPLRHMQLLPGEIRGIAGLRAVARLFFDGLELPSALEAKAPVPSLPAPVMTVPREFLRRLVPDGARRTVFFAGKGGVGKTVASCVTAVWLARQGYRTLLLTTDPAAHLGDVLGVPVGPVVAGVPGLDSLWAAKIDSKTAAESYKARILDDARRRGRPPAVIQVMAEELDSPCTEEMAAFDQFIDYAAQDGWQAVVFDTAPTGHTLRLLQLPVAWSKQLDVKVFATVGTTAADDVAKRRFGQVIDMMRDPAQSTFAFVMYPEATPILEAYRAAEELRTVGITPGLVVANFLIPPDQATTPFSRARRAMQQRYLAEIGQRFPVPMVQIPLLPQEVRGLAALSELGRAVYGSRRAAPAAQRPASALAAQDAPRVEAHEHA